MTACRSLWVLTLLLLALSTHTHAAPPTTALITEILELSGLEQQFEEIQRFAISEADNRKEGLAPGTHAALRQSLGTAFATAKLRANVIAVFKEFGDHNKLQQWRTTLQSPLMRRMRALEQAATRDEAYAATIEFGRHLENLPPPTERVTLIMRLATVTAATELALDSHIAVTRALLHHINPTLPDNKKLDLKKENAILSDVRAQLAEQMNDVTIVTYLYTYREITDADLREYISSYESEAGRSATELTARALRKALQQGTMVQ